MFGQQPVYADVVAGGQPKSKRGLVLGGGALALAIVAGGGIYMATQAGNSGGGQPEDLVPSTAFAFAKVDLDPAADQKVAIHEFSSKFPKAPKTTATDPIDGLLTEAFKDNTGKCTYAADIKPWLGKRIGLAGIAGTAGKSQPLLVLQVKDTDKAKAAIAKLSSNACAAGDGSKDNLKGYTIKDGYAVISTTQADVDAALAASKSKSLKDLGTYDKDVAKLDGSQVVVLWADLKASFDAAAKESPQLNVIPNGVAKLITGRMVLGLHMANNYAELSGRVIGSDTSKMTGATPDSLTKLPKSTVVAASFNGLQGLIEQQLTQLGAVAPNLDSALGAMGGGLGLDLKKDLLPLLGSTTTFSLGNIPKNPLDAQFGLQSTITDPAAAAAAGKKLQKLAAKQGIKLDTDVAGKTFYLTSAGYAATLKGDGGLGTSPAFTAAMGSLGDKVSGAVFMDIGQLSKLAGPNSTEAAPISAFGMSYGKDGSDAYLRMRLVVK
ncbi:MAG: DUF3352 domain-containing protein [Actinomycetota bacterium]